MKKTISILLAIIMLFTMLPMATFAEELNTPKLTIDSADATPGDTVSVNVSLKNNPGIVAGQVNVAFDSGLTLVGATRGDAFPAHITYTMPKQLSTVGEITGNCNIVWGGTDIEDGDIRDGVILVLSFRVSADAEIGDVYSIIVTPSGVNDKELLPVELQAVQSRITIIDYTPGDVNDDGEITMLDTVIISRYIVDGCTYDPNGYAIRLNEKAADVNDDGIISMLDTVMISRYIVDGCRTDPNGYNIELKGSTKKCQHEMQATAAKAATCTEDGNIAYWYCGLCDKYFSDANGSHVITLDNTVIAATGHTIVIDPAVPATETTTGLTEGSHCSVCGAVIIAQEEIPMLESEQYNITYHVSNGDTYLATISIDNPNPSTYRTAQGLTLRNVSTPGYTFLGWYDLPAGVNAANVKKIAVGETGDVELYAHWQKIEYTIQFTSDLIPVNEIKYTVDKGATLPSPSLDGYIFAGWSDGEGCVLKTVPKGTTGNLIYSANWLSERNQAWTKTKLDDPIIIEDDSTNTILFTYEIGEIRNVPLYVIEDFGKINSNGISRTVTKTFSTTVTDSQMQNYTNTVSNATTESYGMTLSSGWSDSTSIDESWARENGMSTEEASTYCKSDTSGWYVSSGSSGSSTTQTLDTKDTYDLNTGTLNGKSSSSSTSGHESEVNGKVGVDMNASLGNPNVAQISTDIHAEIGASDKNSSSSTTGNESGWGSSDQTGSISHTGTNSTSSASWNSESGYNASSTVSNTTAISKAVSEKISTTYGYGRSYIKTGDESSTQSLASTASSSDSYSSSVTYSNAVSESQTLTYTTTNTMSGYHRWIMAGTAHVFAIVGYDIATKSFFINTYSVMDDEMHQYEDYSYSYASYDDNQNGQISFEVPTMVSEYVAERVCETSGLEINKEGVITNYTGTSDSVIIPEYKVIDNLDGTTQVIKVVGINAGVFSGKDFIINVDMSDYITQIPNELFKGCTSLVFARANSVVSVGDEAFSGCTALKAISIGDTVTSIGNNAFDSVETFTVNAANADIVDAAVNSGAKNITVTVSEKCVSLDNETLTLFDTTETFTFNGMGKTYTDLYIVADAEKTVINRASFVSTGATPLKISSEEVELNQVTVTASGIGLMLTADDCDLKLYGESNINSTSENAVLCRNITLSQLKNDYFSRLNVDGNILICGQIENASYLNCIGEIITIDEDAYGKYLQGTFIVSFDANGGNAVDTTLTVYYGQPYGTLPTPTRTGFTFDGWYTEKSGGTKITDTTVVSAVVNHTLYAHWTVNSYTASWNTGTGYSITVKRTSSPNKGATTGNLSSGSTVYYGDVLGITYTASTGYTLKTKGSTSVTVTGNVTSSTIYATASVNTYKVSWNTGSNYTITVKRTSSPYASAGTGTLSNGATVYYGDVLSVTYSASTGYSIASKGATSITVTGNVTSSNIYCTVTANSYTYTIKYESTNGTNLGSSSATYKFGTTNTISAPSKAGYNTPSSQTVVWNKTSNTITFKYSPIGQPTRQTIASGSWWPHSSSTHLDYVVEAEWRNRTANSVDIRIIWTNTLTATGGGGYYGYKQEFEWWGWYTIAEASTFRSPGGTRSSSATSDWHTYSISPTDTSWTTCSEWRDNNGRSGDWSGTIYFPAY